MSDDTLNINSSNELVALSLPQQEGILSNKDILWGTYTQPIDKLKILSPKEYEDIVLEWILGFHQKNYLSIWKPAGSNDKGRDIVGIFDDQGNWDNFQCKHYDHPLAPSDIWLELGKLCYYTYIGNFSIPRKYYFMAPQGVGATLGDLLKKADDLKNELFKAWDQKCKTSITKNQSIDLTDSLKSHIQNMDFSVFDFIEPQLFIDQFKQTSYFAARFGGGLNKKRTKPQVETFNDSELVLRYIEQLLEAYSDYTNQTIKDLSDLEKNTELHEHFFRQREYYYWAEALNTFSRDQLPPGNTCFGDLMDEIYAKIIDISNEIYNSGYDNIKKTTKAAMDVIIHSNPLIGVLHTQDKAGICHHLADADKIIWVKK